LDASRDAIVDIIKAIAQAAHSYALLEIWVAGADPRLLEGEGAL
jgi:hypothetical protein